jgi:hypothetical protein
VFLGGLLFLGRGCLMAQKEYQTKGYQTMMSTTVWLPLILCFAARYASTGERREPVFAGLAVAASLLGGFPQVTVYGRQLSGSSALAAGPWLTRRCASCSPFCSVRRNR